MIFAFLLYLFTDMIHLADIIVPCMTNPIIHRSVTQQDNWPAFPSTLDKPAETDDIALIGIDPALHLTDGINVSLCQTATLPSAHLPLR